MGQIFEVYYAKATVYVLQVIIPLFINIEAAYRFYKTRREGESVKKRGLEEEKKISRRRHERIVRVG